MKFNSISKRAVVLGVVAIVLLAAGLRTWQVTWDLPYVYHPDEPYYVWIVQNIFKTGDLNPHFFNYPSLFLYINVLAYAPYYLLGKAFGVLNSPSNILSPTSLALGVTIAPMPGVFTLGRAISILLGTMVVLLVYMIGWRLTGDRWKGILASWMAAISPTLISHSRLITADVYVVFFALLTTCASVSIFRGGAGKWHYIAAGIGAGLTMSSKYNGVLILLCVHAAHFLQPKEKATSQRYLYLALGVTAIVFLATTPFAVLDSRRFLNDFLYEIQHYRTGHPGMEGNAFGWYLSYLWSVEGIVTLLALMAILFGFFKRSKRTVFLSLFPVVYFALVSTFKVRNDRTLIPILPFLFLLTSDVLMEAWEGIRKRTAVRPIRVMLLSLVFLVLAVPFRTAIRDGRNLTTVNQSRTAAREWIRESIPIGSKIALEAYAPYINPESYSVQGFLRIIDHTQDWYRSNGIDYLVFSRRMFGDFFMDQETYEWEVSQYREFFTSFELCALFDDGVQELRLYRVTK
ncbi:MAG: phospholipid carrier-dependent glycosyltransferase [Anaerolineales bacterium]|jgi:4-amino-4-deoxy-L-arabinose transferase-like glycosyltransferase